MEYIGRKVMSLNSSNFINSFYTLKKNNYYEFVFKGK